MVKTVDIITMGCSKNLVDSEHLIYRLNRLGFNAYHNPEEIHNGIVVVNTCGFIESAKQESIDMILELCQAKEHGRVKKLYVMGCLSQRYKGQLEEEIPQVDEYFGKFDWKNIIKRLEDYSQEWRNGNVSETGPNTTVVTAENNSSCLNLTGERILTTPKHYAYVKISEGCDRRCAYCVIPIITGRQVSREIEDIVSEVRGFVATGTKEFQIIAQDSTSYGTDNYGRRALPELVERLSDIKGVEWLRIHYAYPNDFPERLLKVINERDNVCKYLDLAFQHVNDDVLSKMHRNITRKETYALIKQIREQVPDIALRTTLMVGFPGETEAAFDELVDFVRDVRFERMGAFAYSEEEGTYAAAHYEDNIPQEVKQERLERLMMEQQRISAEICSQKVGKVFKTIIDRIEGDYYVGRTQYDSPDVDGEVLINISKQQKKGKELTVGDFYNAQVLSSTEFDLFAEVN